MFFRALLVLGAILAGILAAPEPKADPQFLYASGLSTPYIYTSPYSAGSYPSYGSYPYAAGYYHNNYAYSAPYGGYKTYYY